MLIIVALAAELLPLLLVALFALRWRRRMPKQSIRRLLLSLGSVNAIALLLLVGLGLVWLFAPQVVLAAGLRQQTTSDPYATLAAAISVGVGSIGAAYAVGVTGSAAIGAIAEKPELFGRALIFVGLAEGVAIYGLIIAFIILTR